MAAENLWAGYLARTNSRKGPARLAPHMGSLLSARIALSQAGTREIRRMLIGRELFDKFA
jgi:hypothetical protein